MVAILPKVPEMAGITKNSPVGLDVGNGALKIVSAAGEFRLDSYICYLRNRLGMGSNSGYVEYLEGSRKDLVNTFWIGGINAYYHNPRGLARVTDNKFGKVELGLQLLLSGLSTMPYRPELNLSLVASVHDGKTLAMGLRKALTGTHLIRIQNKECRVTINVISVLEEGTGAVIHYQNQANFSNAILYDLGNGTLIVSSFNGLNMTHRSYSQNGGVESLIDAIAANDHVRSQLLREGDRHLIRAGIEDGAFSYGTQYPGWTFTEAYKEELPRWVHGVLAPMVRPTEDRRASATALIAIGGGACLPGVAKLLTQKNIKVLPDPQWANARGLYAHALRKVGV